MYTTSIIIHGAPVGTAHVLTVNTADNFAKRDSYNTAFNFDLSKGDGANGNIQ
jgi:hypothetical protein